MTREHLLFIFSIGLVAIAAAGLYAQQTTSPLIAKETESIELSTDFSLFIGLNHAAIDDIQIILDEEYSITSMHHPEINGAIAVLEAESKVDTIRIEAYTLESIAEFNQYCLDLPYPCSYDPFPIEQNAVEMHMQFFAEAYNDVIEPRTEQIGNHRYFYTDFDCEAASCPEAVYTTFVNNYLFRVYRAPDSVTFSEDS